MSTDEMNRIGEERITFCRICTAACGLVVTLEDDEIVGIRGDRDHPDSAGYTCPKGRALGAHHQDPRRLNEPMLRGSVTTWDACLDDLGANIARLIETAGRDSLGTYIATGHFCDKGGLLAERRLTAAIGTTQCYSGATVDGAPAWFAAELVTGYPLDVNPVWEPEQRSPSVAVIFGQNPVVSHGYFSILTDPIMRIRKFRNQGGKLWVVDPCRTETAGLADQHLAIRPGTDIVLLAWLIRELLIEGADQHEIAHHCHAEDIARLQEAVEPFTRDVAVELTELDGRVLDELLHQIRGAGRIACLTGTGITFGPHPAVTEWLRWALLIITGSIDRPGGMRCADSFFAPKRERAVWEPAPVEGSSAEGPPSRPNLGRFRNEFPVVALAQEIEAGNVRGLLVSGGNPLASVPDPARTAAAFRSLEFLAVVGVVHNELTNLATHILPVASQLERADMWLQDRAMYTPPVVPPRARRRPGWWVFAQIGRRLGHDVLGGLDPDVCGDEAALQFLSGASPERFAQVVAAGSRGLRRPRHDGWVRERALPGGRWRVAPQPLVDRLPEVLGEAKGRAHIPLQLTTRRQVKAMNSAFYVRPDVIPAAPNVLLHSHDAARLGIADGSRVVVSTAAGQLEADAQIDDRLRVGAVSMSQSSAEPNVTRLISQVENIEDFTGQPRMTAVAVTVTPISEPC
ncbi:MAG: molybdopterin-dependent oxidoreductase [Acidimicrobiales bacterium]|jgi:anaerobic selenocysteine-containing dehydrogenase